MNIKRSEHNIFVFIINTVTRDLQKRHRNITIEHTLTKKNTIFTYTELGPNYNYS